LHGVKSLTIIMTKHITTTLFILLASALTAQTKEKTFFVGDVISDTTTFVGNSPRKTLTPILKSENKIEIRFISSTSFYQTTYLVMIFNKDWSAKYYYFNTDSDSLLHKDITNKTNIDTVFSRLVSNNIFSLPNQDSLRTVKYEYHPESNEFIGSGMGFCDGICYYIEFKVGNYYRRYSYCNPESYSDFYPHVYELKNFTNIVEIFNEWTKE